MRRFPILIFLCVVSVFPASCVPLYSRVQPDAHFTVINDKGDPITNARILFISASNPHSALHHTIELFTDEEGKATLTSEQEWEMANFLMIHGVTFYHWAWCVQKEGYNPVVQKAHATDWKDDIIVTLRPGFINGCCTQDGGYLKVGQCTYGGRMQEASVVRARFERANPILSVSDMSRSLRYYVDVLGFTNAEWGGDDFTCVTRDSVSIYLCQGDQGGPGTWVWVGVDDVEALYREYQATGATIAHPPKNYPWAYEMNVTDPDGHVLRFGSPPREDILLK